MAKNLLAVSDALIDAEGANQGLNAIVDLLFSANQSDMPSGRSLGELLLCVKKEITAHLERAKAGLRDSK